ncbi:MAG: hypothetical protein HY261_08975 [Chloroflexi bacterium]|nr:hypothetical protein [Chloroflexota bacterium]
MSGVSGERRESKVRAFLRFALERPTVLRGVKVAAIVAPILTVINQWGKIVHHHFDVVFFLKLILTACVPFCVSVTSSALANMARAKEHGVTN